MREDLRHQFENLTQEGISVVEYKIQFYAFFYYTIVIFLDEAEMIKRFMRGFTLWIIEVVFTVAQSWVSLQGMIESEKEIKLMDHEEYGNLRDKRSYTSSRLSTTSFGGWGSFRQDFCH